MGATKRFLEDVSVFMGLNGEITDEVVERAQDMLDFGVTEVVHVQCSVCGVLIPPERLVARPGTTECVECVKTDAVVGFMVPQASKGCASELMMVTASNSEGLRQAFNASRRRR